MSTPQRNDVDALTKQLKEYQQECRDIEGMRQTAVDSVRSLEHEVLNLQDKDRQLQEAQAELQYLREQVSFMWEIFSRATEILVKIPWFIRSYFS